MISLVKNNRSESDTIIRTKSLTIDANNTTVNENLFLFTGTVFIHKLYGIVTTTLGASHVGAYLRAFANATNVEITDNGGTTLNDYPAGSLIGAILNSTNAMAESEANTVKLLEDSSNKRLFNTFMLQADPANNSYIQYTYTTTDAPTSGVIKFYCEYSAISEGATLAAS